MSQIVPAYFISVQMYASNTLLNRVTTGSGIIIPGFMRQRVYLGRDECNRSERSSL